MTIMNVDDSVTMRKIVTLALKAKGYSVIEADNGKIALSLLLEHSIDAIILDINMPIMNGIEFLQEFKNNPNSKKIPVIVLTTQGEDSLKMSALELGAKDFLVKPFQKDDLVMRLERLLS